MYIPFEKLQQIFDKFRLIWYKITEYRNITLLENTTNQSSKFKAKNWVKMKDDVRGTYNANSQIEFKTTMLRSSLCDYTDGYIFREGIITDTAGTADNWRPCRDRCWSK